MWKNTRTVLPWSTPERRNCILEIAQPHCAIDERYANALEYLNQLRTKHAWWSSSLLASNSLWGCLMISQTALTAAMDAWLATAMCWLLASSWLLSSACKDVFSICSSSRVFFGPLQVFSWLRRVSGLFKPLPQPCKDAGQRCMESSACDVAPAQPHPQWRCICRISFPSCWPLYILPSWSSYMLFQPDAAVHAAGLLTLVGQILYWSLQSCTLQWELPVPVDFMRLRCQESNDTLLFLLQRAHPQHRAAKFLACTLLTNLWFRCNSLKAWSCLLQNCRTLATLSLNCIIHANLCFHLIPSYVLKGCTLVWVLTHDHLLA